MYFIQTLSKVYKSKADTRRNCYGRIKRCTSGARHVASSHIFTIWTLRRQRSQRTWKTSPLNNKTQSCNTQLLIDIATQQRERERFKLITRPPFSLSSLRFLQLFPLVIGADFRTKQTSVYLLCVPISRTLCFKPGRQWKESFILTQLQLHHRGLRC